MTYCSICQKKVEYITRDIQKFTGQDRNIPFEGKEAHCAHCKNPVHADSVFEYNLQQAIVALSPDLYFDENGLAVIK